MRKTRSQMSMIVPMGQSQPQKTRPSKRLRRSTGRLYQSRGRIILRRETMADSARHERVRQGTRALGVSQAVGSRGELLHIARSFAEEQGRSLSTWPIPFRGWA